MWMPRAGFYFRKMIWGGGWGSQPANTKTAREPHHSQLEGYPHPPASCGQQAPGEKNRLKAPLKPRGDTSETRNTTRDVSCYCQVV